MAALCMCSQQQRIQFKFGIAMKQLNRFTCDNKTFVQIQIQRKSQFRGFCWCLTCQMQHTSKLKMHVPHRSPSRMNDRQAHILGATIVGNHDRKDTFVTHIIGMCEDQKFQTYKKEDVDVIDRV